MIIVTGGAGFIGSNFILNWLSEEGTAVINLDKLTYAGNPENLASVQGNDSYVFVQGDICDQALVKQLFKDYRPWAVVNFAAESHVDRSILGPSEFIQTNVLGTFTLLEVARAYWSELDQADKNRFRFLHVSTDEVYGSLGPEDPAFCEDTPFSPNSPYAASKASSDHMVRAWNKTYGLPTLITNCSNNYGPRQFPEKLIPLTIYNALKGEPLPIYGDGQNIRDWLYVEDHCEAVRVVLKTGCVGQTYNIGSQNEKTNLETVTTICRSLDALAPRADGSRYEDLITFVADRPGHDRRYAIDATKIEKELGWHPGETFESGIEKTIRWYIDNHAWVENITSGAYRNWIEMNYASRL